MLPAIGLGTGACAAASATTVSGPLKGGRFSRPFSAFLGDLSAVDYVEEEYILSGEASRFRPVGELSPDGRWTVESAGALPYRTRILVRRPRDPARFNGTLILEWINVTVGFDIAIVGDTLPGIYADGFAFATISCQRIGVDGFAKEPQGLKVWDPARYGELSIPEESLCYDIFSQAARALGPNRPSGGPDPMGGLAVKRVIGTGASQSAIKLRTYINGVHPHAKVFDGFVPLLDFGTVLGFDNYVFDTTVISEQEQGRLFERQAKIRDDLTVPVLVVNSQSETLSYFPSRQPDSAKFRFWEIAGAAHDPAPSLRRMQLLFRRDQLKLDIPAISGSEVEWAPTADAGFLHMHKWLIDGTPPPTCPPISVAAGAKPAILLDASGNARGGLRLPELEVPVATYTVNADQLDLMGKTTAFSAETLKGLYPSPQNYVDRVTAAATRTQAAGFIRPWRTLQYVEAARKLPAWS